MHRPERISIRRRSFLLGSGAAFAGGALWPAWANDAIEVRVVANGGVENRTLLELMRRQGFLVSLGVEQALVVVDSPSATLEAVMADRADACIISGFNGLLRAIEKEAPVKVIGAALQSPALAVYTSRPEIRAVADLADRSVGIGPNFGLLHVTMIALLRAKGVDPAKIRFVNVGSNAEVYQAIKIGKVEAGPSDVSNLADAEGSGLRVLADGKMWGELADYPYQLAYASDRAIRDNRDGLVRTLAAYGKLFRFLSSATSWDAYAEARTVAGGGTEANARAAWNYIQTVQPYAGSPLAPQAHLDYLQALYVSLGLQKSVLPIERIADPSLARDAMRLM
jgi:NitT/TauT family transport system substrate-binding protein